MLDIVTEDEQLDLQAELDEYDEYDFEAEDIVHEMTDWVKFELEA